MLKFYIFARLYSCYKLSVKNRLADVFVVVVVVVVVAAAPAAAAVVVVSVLYHIKHCSHSL